MSNVLAGKKFNPLYAGGIGGALLGFLVGGPAGAVIGAIAGYGGGKYAKTKYPQLGTGFVSYQPFNRFPAAQISSAIAPGSAPVSATNPGGQAITHLQIATANNSLTPVGSYTITLNPVSFDLQNAGRYLGIVAHGSAAGVPGTQLDFLASEVMAMGGPDATGQLVWNQGNV